VTPEQQAAYINAQACCASLEGAAMHAANVLQIRQGEPPPFGYEAFIQLIDKYGIGHNAVIGFFRS
jgi:hypothetical protein